MRKVILTISLMATIAMPSLALAASNRCEQAKHDKKVEGTVVGGALGAIGGALIAPKHDKLLGAAVGGVAGAAVGNNMSRSKERCPDGYVRRHYDERYYDTRRNAYKRSEYSDRCHWEDRNGEQYQVCH